MKFKRTLVQALVLGVVLLAFSYPVRSETTDTGDALTAQPATNTENSSSHHLFSTLGTELESGWFGDVAVLAAVLFSGRAIWLVLLMEPKTIKRPLIEQSVAEVPPLRPIPERITLF